LDERNVAALVLEAYSTPSGQAFGAVLETGLLRCPSIPKAIIVTFISFWRKSMTFLTRAFRRPCYARVVPRVFAEDYHVGLSGSWTGRNAREMATGRSNVEVSICGKPR
jgi:hypothetical protein